jgi:branched-subunit amino acid aminotransferase/4-amino-4-deoxychorismate lyase
MKYYILLDNEWISSQKGLLDSLNPWALKGEGVFETMRSYQGTVFALNLHLDRMFKGLRILRIKPAYSKRLFAWKIASVIKINRLKDARIRLVVWREQNKDHFSITANPLRFVSVKNFQKGYTVCLSGVKVDETAKACSLKSIRYQRFIRAYEQARGKGFDEALLFNRRGSLVEGSRGNIFLVNNGVLFTPPLSSGCLPGITRSIVLRLAKKMKITYRVVNLSKTDLLSAQEVFLTSSVVEIMPITTIHQQCIGDGQSGFLTGKLAREYSRFARQNISNSV